MEITLLEDPACHWCWAFEPVMTALLFEVVAPIRRKTLRLRRVMGGLRDWPFIEASFFARQWEMSARLSGMPFNASVWERPLLRSTFEACRVVKAAQYVNQRGADRLLRRIREA